MNLQNLLAPLLAYRVQGNYQLDQLEITSLEFDSRKVKEGALFVCLEGLQADGHHFVQQAKQRGALAILAQKPVEVDLPVILLSDTRRALALLASRFYQNPTTSLRLIGVTGTNGKTTTTYLIEKILEEQGCKSGRIGTINMKIGNDVLEVNNTTPESLELQRAFAQMVEAQAEYAVIEVSSHAIDMGRLRGCNFGTLIFTNLTQDHLDYHGTMEEYKRVKGLIFAQLGNRYEESDPKYAILNADDPASEYYQRITPAQVLTYGLHNQADILAKDITLTSSGTSFTVDSIFGQEQFSVKLLGTFNIYNMLAAIGAGLVEGFSLKQIKTALEKVEGVSGRVELIDEGQDFSVIVDYAHTPDSLKNVLTMIQEFAQGNIFCIVGCGGDRDRLKRPIMAEIAAHYADQAIFTADNPRSEEPQAIINDMLEGVRDNPNLQAKYKSISDRRQAIEWAINQAQCGDVILIAGKGHEAYQIIKNDVLFFDDRLIAREALHKRQRTS